MSSPAPLLDPILWARWLGAFVLLVGLPGFLLVGRFLPGASVFFRLPMSVASGILMAPILARAFTWAGLAFNPWIYLPCAIGLAVGVGFVPAYRRAISHISSERDTPRAVTGVLALCCAGMAIILLAGLGQLSAPPHLHDASNHAFMTSRIVQTESVDPGRVFGEPYGPPHLPYLYGWHMSAALIARLSGVAPYISMWFLPLVCVVLLPAALAGLWREFRLPWPVVCLAATYPLVSMHLPIGVVAWGGYGHLVAAFLLPALVVIIRAFLQIGSLWLAGLLGLFMASLVMIHLPEVMTTLLLTLVMIPWLPHLRNHPRRIGIGLGFAILVMLLLAGIETWEVVSQYRDHIAGREQSRPGLVLALKHLAGCATTEETLKLLFLVGLVSGVFHPRVRRVSILCAVMGLFYLSLVCIGDPITRLLSTPYFQEGGRILYVQTFLVPPLLAFGIHQVQRWVRARLRFRWVLPVLLVLLILMILPAGRSVRDSLRDMQVHVPFGPDEHALSLRLADIVPLEGRVANFRDDGSYWAMHVSGRPFINPTSWQLRPDNKWDYLGATLRVLDKPWPEAVWSLQREGVDFLFVSDRRMPGFPGFAHQRQEFDADPRFEKLLEGRDASLYGILWDEGRTPD